MKGIKNMKKYRIIALSFVTTLVLILMVGCVEKNENKDGAKITVVDNDSSITSAQENNTSSNMIYKYNLEFLGNDYSLPMSVSDFRRTGWTFDTFFDIYQEKLEPGKTASYAVIKNQEKIRVKVINNTNDILSVSECHIGEITFSFSNYEDYSVTLAKSLEINNTTKYDEVIKKWGEATYNSSNANGTVLKYEKSDNSFYYFNFDKNGTIIYFIIRNWNTDS